MRRTTICSRRRFLQLSGMSAALAAASACRPVALATSDAAAIQRELNAAYEQYKGVKEGANASYIPALANVPSDLFGIAAVTPAGELFTAGDADYPFAIESISKVFTLALVMEQLGADAVLEKVGAEPTGLPFNSVMAVELHGGQPLSPLVNAGAMSTVSLLPAADAGERWARLLDGYSRAAGRPLALIDEVYRSEAETNFHNRGIAYLLHSYGTMYSDPIDACDVYTKQCSVAVTAHDLAVMGAALATGGVNPVSGERILSAPNVPHILAEMMMEGLYDASGDWAYTVGLPAKSGVGGGILAVAPGVLSIAAFAPPLDAAGNSVRAALAIRSVAEALGLNLFAGLRAA